MPGENSGASRVRDCLPRLNQICRNEAGDTWPWDDGAGDTWYATITAWNNRSNLALSGKPQVDAQLLVDGLNQGIWSKVKKFKTQLKTMYLGALELPIAPVNFGDEHYWPDSWRNHMHTLLVNSQLLWDNFGAYNRNILHPIPNSDIPPNDYMDLNSQTIHAADNVYIVTDPNFTFSTAIQNSKTPPDIYYRPEAKDILGALAGRYNPPPHKATRSFPPTAFYGTAEIGTSKLNANGSPKSRVYIMDPVQYYNENKDVNWNLKKIAEVTNRQLGFMYQDAANVNKLKTTSTTKKNKKTYSSSVNGTWTMQDLWGFQFTYNPTSISYANSSDPSIDWTGYGGTMSEGDASAILFGNGTVSVKLFLNRLYDVGALRSTYQKKFLGNGFTPPKGYPRELTFNEVVGILSRGTEYDLEFLYRVLNGDPEKSPTMRNGQKTADFGLIYGMPVWIRFHDNLRYKVVVSTMSVNHVLFTPDMIPVLTEVDLQMTRIPVITYDNEEAGRVRDSLKTNTSSQGNSAT